jgi:hypothetical protein
MNHILWRRWKDPISETLDQDGEDDLEDMGPSMTMKRWTQRLGPMLVNEQTGDVIPVNESIRPSNAYNFWMGYTNFELLEGHVRDIKAIVGVESFDLYTPLRFRIAVGRAFEEHQVLEQINQATKCKRTAKRTTLELVQHILGNSKGHWCIQFDANGKMNFKFGETPDLVNKQIVENDYRLITSW